LITLPSSRSVVRPDNRSTQGEGIVLFPCMAPSTAPMMAAMVSLSLVPLAAPEVDQIL
jgi:hypothetical protein